MARRVVLVAVSPRTPPGLLSWPAWQALRSAPVVTALAEHVPALRRAGVELVDALPEDGDVVVLAHPDTDVRHDERIEGSYDPPGARLLDVVAVMDRLRSPGGCPWDAEQTHRSLMPYLLEEAYEAYQALEDGDLRDLREELGDVLLQVAFHARLAEEAEEPWSIDDVAGDLVDKLVRRHPHVFAGGSADDLEGTWERLKAAEKGRASVTDGVPLAQPALSLAAKLQKRAGRLGAPVPAYGGLGGDLWEAVAICREAGVDPEVELRGIARAFRDRLASVEAELRREGRDPGELTAEEWAARWR